MRQLHIYLFLILLPFLWMGCSGRGPTIDYDPQSQWHRLQSFDIAKVDGRIDPLDEERITKAIARILRAKEYRRELFPDFIVKVHLKTDKNVPSKISFGLGIGGGNWRHGGVGIHTAIRPHYDIIHVSIDTIETKRQKVFWNSTIDKKISNLNGPQAHERFWNELIYELLEKFPKRSQSNQ